MDSIKNSLAGGASFAQFDDGESWGAPVALGPVSTSYVASEVSTPSTAASVTPSAPESSQGSVKKQGPDGKAGIAMAAFNLINMILGAGVGGMPYALKEAGFYMGIILLCVVAMSADYSVRLLIRLGVKVNKKYYEQLVSSQFGHTGYVAVSAAMGIFAYGAMCAYLIGIGDTMSIVVSHWAGVNLIENPWIKRVVLVCIAIFAVLPLALVKDMAKLSKTSALSLCSVIFITIVVFTRFVTGPGDAAVPTTEEDKTLHFVDVNLFPAIGIISFAFVCHHACFIVYNTLRDNTEARWTKTVHLSLGVALVVMLALSMSAYLTFRGVMNGNFLTNYSFTDELVNFMRMMFAVTQTLTYPLELYVCRHSIHALAFASEKKFSDRKHLVITTLLWGSSLAIALNVTDLSVVLELTGGVSAVFIGFVMPAMLHFKLSSYKWKLWQNPPAKRLAAAKELVPSIALLIFGVLAIFFTLFTIIGNLISGEAHGPSDAYAHGSNGLDTETQIGANATTGHLLMML